MYQKRDYELFAGIIKGVSVEPNHTVNWESDPIPLSNGALYVSRRALVRSLADAFEADNPAFDRSKFFLASGEAYDLGRLEASE